MITPTGVEPKADDRQSQRVSKGNNNKRFISNRRIWFISSVMLIAVISLAIGLGVGIKSKASDVSFSRPENVSKSSWPELVGMDAGDALAWMKENYPEYHIYVVNYGEYVTTEFNDKRVRIYKAPNGTVSTVPKIGR